VETSLLLVVPPVMPNVTLADMESFSILSGYEKEDEGGRRELVWEEEGS
jgi:hypothetical protein